VANVKRDFRRILDDAERGCETIVLRHGKAVAVIGPPPSSRAPLPRAAEGGGLLSIVGLLREWDDIDDDLAAIVAARRTDQGRPPPDLD
jgi:antitoxin (DNA-binding transcriptional repressor) of toxin-antitoxin stability system